MTLDIITSILLFSFSIPIVMKYRILPIDGTPYWLFGVLFALLVSNFVTTSRRLKNWILIAVLGIVLIGVSITAMVDRNRTAPVFGVHDIILQQEAAMRYLIIGKNPYKETYFGTPVESFHYAEMGNDKAVNPALYHFVMPPWYLVFPFTFYYTVRPIVGFFDGRMVSLFTMALLLVSLWYWFKDKAVAWMAIVITALSPAVIDYFVEGRSDVFALSWLTASLVLLDKKRFVLSACFMMLAFLSKQTTWFILPFYAIFFWKNGRNVALKSAVVATIIGLVILLPFLLWDPKAFLDSVVFYLSGNSQYSYPISGYGFGMALYAAGVIRDIHAYYPFIIWQLLACVPLFFVLIRGKLSQSKLMLSYALFLFVFWYFSRYFNNSHLGYLSMLFVLTGLKQIDEGHT